MMPSKNRSITPRVATLALAALLGGSAVASATEIGNLVFKDLNNNGLREPAEPGIPDVNVHLVDMATSTVVGEVQTDMNGEYLFSNEVKEGVAYDVRLPLSGSDEKGLNGCGSSSGVNGSALGPYEPAPNPNDGIDNDDNGQLNAAGDAIVLSKPVTLDGKTQTTNLNVDFGVVCYAKLGDFVWEDVNRNGLQDAAEPGINGVTVTLRNAAGSAIATTTTSGNGAYGFANLTPVTPGVAYSVRFQTPAGMTPTVSSGVIDDALNSDASATDGATSTVILADNQNNPNIDAGFFRPPTVTTPVVVPGPVTPVTPAVVVPPPVPVVAARRVSRPAALTISKTGPASVAAGTTASYQIVVRAVRVGGITARGVVLRDLLPAGMTIVRRGQFGRSRLQAGVVTWSLGNIAPGGSRSINVLVRVASDARGTLRNRATAQAANARAVQDVAVTVVAPRPQRRTPAVTG